MADKEDTPAGAEGEEGAPPPKGKMKLIIIAAAAVVVIAVGVGGYMAFFRKHADEHHAEAAPVVKPPVFMEVPEVLVNLAAQQGERTQYLKVKIVLEVKEQHLADTIKPAMPRVMDTFQTYMRELRPSDLNGSGGLYRLREELTKRVNVAIAPNQVNAVLFKEVVIQ